MVAKHQTAARVQTNSGHFRAYFSYGYSLSLAFHFLLTIWCLILCSTSQLPVRLLWRNSYQTIYSIFVQEISQLSVEYRCEDEEEDACSGLMVIYGEYSLESEMDELQVTISTSASANNNEIDFTQVEISTTPFAIFAKIQHSSLRPVRNIEKVVARLQMVGTIQTFDVDLMDDGLGTPDTFVNDGIYSASWIPASDGVYKISVSIFHNLTSSTSRTSDETYVESEYMNAIGRLMPKDQVFTCETGQCNGISPSQNYFRVIRSPYELSVINSNAWIDKVSW